MKHFWKLSVVAVATTFVITGCSSTSPEDWADYDKTRFIDESTLREWPTKFCSLRIGFKRDKVQKTMGKPTWSVRNQSENYDQYEAGVYVLYIHYDKDDRAIRVIPLSDNVPCDAMFSIEEEG